MWSGASCFTSLSLFPWQQSVWLMGTFQWDPQPRLRLMRGPGGNSHFLPISLLPVVQRGWQPPLHTHTHTMVKLDWVKRGRLKKKKKKKGKANGIYFTVLARMTRYDTQYVHCSTWFMFNTHYSHIDWCTHPLWNGPFTWSAWHCLMYRHHPHIIPWNLISLLPGALSLFPSFFYHP